MRCRTICLSVLLFLAGGFLATPAPGATAADPPQKPVLQAQPPPARKATPQPATPILRLPDRVELPPLSGGASLSRQLSGDLWSGADEDLDPAAGNTSYLYQWDVSRVPQAGAVRWQVATRPFPEFARGAAADLEPPGLIATGLASGTSGAIRGDFSKLLARLAPTARTPDQLHVRILPLRSAAEPRVVGLPSNVIRVFYAARMPQPDTPPVVIINPNPHLFEIKIGEFQLPDFYDPNRWGCVVVTGHDPEAASWANVYPVGKEICPQAYRGAGQQVTSFGEFVTWMANGLPSAFDWVVGAYNGLKQGIVDAVLKYTGVCELVGQAGKAAADTCRMVVEAAADAGLVALGVPPSLPNFNQLIDEGVQGAVAMAAEVISENTGVPCIGPCRDALEAGFSAAGDKLKRSTWEPACAGEAEAHEHGREPLCLPDGIQARPAPGAIDVPPRLELQVTRTKLAPGPGFRQACGVSARIDFDNHFPGGPVSGPGTRRTVVDAQAVAGQLYAPTGAALPRPQDVAAGGMRTILLAFDKPQKFAFSWTEDLWRTSQIVGRDFIAPYGADWRTLYHGARARIYVTSNCTGGQRASPYPLTLQMPAR